MTRRRSSLLALRARARVRTQYISDGDDDGGAGSIIDRSARTGALVPRVRHLTGRPAPSARVAAGLLPRRRRRRRHGAS